MVDLGAFGTMSPVANLVYRACDPTLHEPNYAVQLELAEHINKKKANTPREAAMTIVRLINHRNPHVSLLALSLLDTLVESCGYPFHLQISTKEFLNELVRRFPERPPFSPGPVMSRILATINGWKEGICVTSRWKEDLGNIRDMHRLLSFKGYRFRDLPRANVALASGSQELKNAEELENEDREAQAAKLQELIRRGTPRDLAAAQELMKIMAGADPDAKPNYRKQSLKELEKLEQKVILLNEMLDNVDGERRERWAAGDVYDQIAAPLVSARPKIQKWISDAESDDPESLAIFLQINDQINNVLARFEAFKRGDYAGVANAVPTNLVGSSRAHAQAQSSDLIDLLDDEPPSVAQSTNTTTDDLASIFGGVSGITSSSSASYIPRMSQTETQTQTRSRSPNTLLSLFNDNGTHSISPPPQGGIALPDTPQPMPSLSHPSSTGSFSTTSYQPTSSSYNPPPQAQQNKDPFADLAGLF